MWWYFALCIKSDDYEKKTDKKQKWRKRKKKTQKNKRKIKESGKSTIQLKILI